MSPILALTIIAAGAAGAALRYGASRAFERPGRHSSNLPWAVFVVNVVGSAIAGVVLALAVRGDVGSDIQSILLTGLCGGLTTFSTLSVETVQLVLSGRVRVAVLSMVGNFALGIGAAAGAYAIVLPL